jgi:hypothetical protein
MSGAYSMHGEKKNAYKALTRKLEGKEVTGRHRRSWEDNVNMDFKEMGFIWLRIGINGGLFLPW